MRKFLAYISILLFVSYGCLDKTSSNLYEDYKKELVIEGRISNEEPPYVVKVSETVAPGNSVKVAQLKDAVVLLNDMNGNSENLEHLGNGLYHSSDIIGSVGEEYMLSVIYEDGSYEAIDVIPPAPRIDSAKLEYTETTLGEGYYVVLYGRNSTSVKSYYKVEFIVNGEPLTGYYDLLILEDISIVEEQSFILPKEFEQDDIVIVNVHSISKTIYEYFRGLNKQVDNLYGTVQAPIINPPSNFENTLGYFMASSVWRDTAEVKE